jgi:hypothetical protein
MATPKTETDAQAHAKLKMDLSAQQLTTKVFAQAYEEMEELMTAKDAMTTTTSMAMVDLAYAWKKLGILVIILMVRVFARNLEEMG